MTGPVVRALGLTVRRQWRSFRAAWARWTAMGVLLAVGLGVIVGLLTSATATLRGIELGAAAGNRADGTIVTEVPLTADQIAGAEAVGARLAPTPYVDVPGRSRHAGTAADISTTVRVLRDDQTLNRPTLDTGTLPSADNEVMIEKLHAAAYGLRVGDQIEVDGRRLRISGIGSLPDYAMVSPEVGQTADPERFVLAVVTAATYGDLAAAHPRDVVSAYGYVLTGATDDELRNHLQQYRLDPARARNPYVARAVEAAAGGGTPLTYPTMTMFLPAADNVRITGVVSDARTTMIVTLVTTILVMLLVAYVLAEFSRDRIMREATIIGTQSALGTGGSALLGHYLVLPLAITAIGSAIGTILGERLAPSLDVVTGYYSFPAVRSEPTGAILAAALGLPIALVGVVNVAVLRRALNRPTQELLRPTVATRASLPLRLDRLPFVPMFRIRQVVRTPGSHLLIVAGLFLCILLMVFGMGMRSSMDRYFTRAGGELSFTDYYTLRFPDLSAVPEGAHEAVAVPMTVIGDDGTPGQTLTVLGLPADNPYFPSPGSDLGAHDLVLSRAAADRYRLGVGDTIALSDDVSLNWAFRIVGIADYTTGAFGFTTPEHAVRLLDPAVPVAAERMAAAGDGRVTVGYYNALFADHPLTLDPDRVLSHSTKEEMLSGVAKFGAILSRIVALVTWTSMLIMVLVLYVLIRMAVARQRYAISLLKALGYSNRQVARLYLDTYLWLVVGTAAPAIPIALAMMGQVWRLMTVEQPIGIPFVLTPVDVAAILGLALGSYAVVRLAVARDTRTVPVTEVLKFRE